MIEKKTNVKCIMFILLLWVMFILGHGHTFYYNYKQKPIRGFCYKLMPFTGLKVSD